MFVPIAASTASVQIKLQETMPGPVRRACKWAFTGRSDKVLPETYCLPKGLKNFVKNRCVIPFKGFFLHELHRGAGRVLGDLARVLLQSDCFDAPPTVAAVHAVRRFAREAQKMSDDPHFQSHEHKLVINNDDIASFFLAPPHGCLMKTAEWILQMYSRSRPAHPWGRPVIFTVFIGNVRKRTVASKTRERNGKRLPLKVIKPVFSMHSKLQFV